MRLKHIGGVGLEAISAGFLPGIDLKKSLFRLPRAGADVDVRATAGQDAGVTFRGNVTSRYRHHALMGFNSAQGKSRSADKIGRKSARTGPPK
jgi:hypothetical protein